MKAAFIDLDSTLADTCHRAHIIDPEDWRKTDWNAYSMACADDTPIEGAVALVRLLHSLGVCIVILSGRSGGPEAEALTREWMHTHTIPYDYLMLRDPSDTRENGSLKRAKIERFCADHPDAEPVLMLDDWPSVRDELAGLVPTLLANPGYPERDDKQRDDSAAA